jgi:hypothetical protein
MDDITSVLQSDEVAPYLQTFQQFGDPIGASHNLSKTTLLSTLDPTTPNTHPSLPTALSLLAPASHLIHGTRLLGSPLGSPAFIASFLHNAAIRFRRHVNCIMKGIPSLQAQFQLFRFCAQSTLPHLLSTDFLRSYSARPPDLVSPSPFAFTSPFITHLNETTSSFLA